MTVRWIRAQHESTRGRSFIVRAHGDIALARVRFESLRSARKRGTIMDRSLLFVVTGAVLLSAPLSCSGGDEAVGNDESREQGASTDEGTATVSDSLRFQVPRIFRFRRPRVIRGSGGATTQPPGAGGAASGSGGASTQPPSAGGATTQPPGSGGVTTQPPGSGGAG